MTRLLTARVREMVGTQVGILRNQVRNLHENDYEQLDRDLQELEAAVKDARAMVAGLPHREPHKG